MTKRNPITALLLIAACFTAGPSTAERLQISTGDIPVAFAGQVMEQGMAIRNDRRRGWRGSRGCAPVAAFGQARRQGISRPTVADANRRRVIVEGNGRFGWGRMVFANTPGCPLIIR